MVDEPDMPYSQGGILAGSAGTVMIRKRGECAVCDSPVFEINDSHVLEHVITQTDVRDGIYWAKIGHYPKLRGSE